MSYDQYARKRQEASSRLGLNVARAWKCFALLLQGYVSRSGVQGVAPTPADKMFALFLLYRDDLQGEAYKRFFNTRGPNTYGNLNMISQQGQTKVFITDHVRFHCETAQPTYIQIVKDHFVPSVTREHITKWIERKQIDSALVEDASEFGWCLGHLSLEEVEDMVIATNEDVVTKGMSKDLTRGCTAFFNTKEETSVRVLDEKIAKAAEWFSAGVDKAETYENKMPTIQDTFESCLSRVKNANADIEQRHLERLMALIILNPQSEVFRRLKWHCKIFRDICSYGHHILSSSPNLSESTNEICTNSKFCKLCGLLHDDVRAASDDVFRPYPQDLLGDFFQLHDDWCRRDDESYSSSNLTIYSSSLRSYVAGLRNWMK